MTITIKATFDGEVFIPAEPVDLPPGMEVRLSRELASPAAQGGERATLDDLMQFAGAIQSGDPRSGDNERIDADMSRESSGTMEPEDAG